MKKLVAFDLDGTLSRTDLFSVAAHQKALALRGIRNIDDQTIIATYGERAQEYVKKLIGETTAEEERRYLDDVAKFEAEFIGEKGKAYDGVKESLKKLREDGYKTAICSNSSIRYITMVLKGIGLFELIDTIQQLEPGLTKVGTLKLLLDREKPDAAVMVGDRKFDVEAGKKNGLKTVGCKYGFHPEEAIEADVVIEHASEIYQAVTQLI